VDALDGLDAGVFFWGDVIGLIGLIGLIGGINFINSILWSG
jgi:hypothetical protein